MSKADDGFCGRLLSRRQTTPGTDLLACKQGCRRKRTDTMTSPQGSPPRTRPRTRLSSLLAAKTQTAYTPPSTRGSGLLKHTPKQANGSSPTLVAAAGNQPEQCFLVPAPDTAATPAPATYPGSPAQVTVAIHSKHEVFATGTAQKRRNGKGSLPEPVTIMEAGNVPAPTHGDIIDPATLAVAAALQVELPVQLLPALPVSPNLANNTPPGMHTGSCPADFNTETTVYEQQLPYKAVSDVTAAPVILLSPAAVHVGVSADAQTYFLSPTTLPHKGHDDVLTIMPYSLVSPDPAWQAALKQITTPYPYIQVQKQTATTSVVPAAVSPASEPSLLPAAAGSQFEQHPTLLKPLFAYLPVLTYPHPVPQLVASQHSKGQVAQDKQHSEELKANAGTDTSATTVPMCRSASLDGSHHGNNMLPAANASNSLLAGKEQAVRGTADNQVGSVPTNHALTSRNSVLSHPTGHPSTLQAPQPESLNQRHPSLSGQPQILTARALEAVGPAGHDIKLKFRQHTAADVPEEPAAVTAMVGEPDNALITDDAVPYPAAQQAAMQLRQPDTHVPQSPPLSSVRRSLRLRQLKQPCVQASHLLTVKHAGKSASVTPEDHATKLDKRQPLLPLPSNQSAHRTMVTALQRSSVTSRQMSLLEKACLQLPGKMHDLTDFHDKAQSDVVLIEQRCLKSGATQTAALSEPTSGQDEGYPSNSVQGFSTHQHNKTASLHEPAACQRVVPTLLCKHSTPPRAKHQPATHTVPAAEAHAAVQWPAGPEGTIEGPLGRKLVPHVVPSVGSPVLYYSRGGWPSPTHLPFAHVW